MRRTAALTALGLSLTLALPASAGTQTDPCGDTAPILQAGPVRQAAPGERGGGFDLKSLNISDLVVGDQPAGIMVTLTLCGDVPAAEVPSSSWQVGWELPGLPEGQDRCSGGLALGDRLRQSDGAVVRTATVNRFCSRSGQTPIFNGVSSTTYQLYSQDLPVSAWQVEGNTIRWTLERGSALGRAAEQVAAGLVLGGPAASTRDGRMVTQLDTDGVRLTGPGTEDRLLPGPDHRIG